MGGILAAAGLNAGEITSSVLVNLITSAIVALVMAVIATLVLRKQLAGLAALVAQLAENQTAIERSLDQRIRQIEVSCPEHRSRLVGKEEIVRLTSSIHGVGRELMERLEEADRHNESRIGSVHDRINAHDQAIGQLQGRIDTLLKSRGVNE